MTRRLLENVLDNFDTIDNDRGDEISAAVKTNDFAIDDELMPISVPKTFFVISSDIDTSNSTTFATSLEINNATVVDAFEAVSATTKTADKTLTETVMSTQTHISSTNLIETVTPLNIILNDTVIDKSSYLFQSDDK